MIKSFSDDEMQAALATSKQYVAVILTAGPNYSTDEATKIIWEHGRRNFALRADGQLDIVCPVTDDTTVRGIGILNTDLATAETIMTEDPAVQAGVLTYTLHPVRSFPGDQLH
jgi:hypothetical protein